MKGIKEKWGKYIRESNVLINSRVGDELTYTRYYSMLNAMEFYTNNIWITASLLEFTGELRSTFSSFTVVAKWIFLSQ